MQAKEAEKYIEGNVYINIQTGGRIVGMNTEDGEFNEGVIRYDILFYVRMKDGTAQIIVNIEMQKDKPYKYKLLHRAVFHVCRLVSSQKERDFANSNFNDIKRV